MPSSHKCGGIIGAGLAAVFLRIGFPRTAAISSRTKLRPPRELADLDIRENVGGLFRHP
jgi:hypothetical protein